MRSEDVFYCIAAGQVGTCDDPGNPRPPTLALPGTEIGAVFGTVFGTVLGTVFGNGAHEFGFANRPQMLGAGFVVTGPALHEYRLDHPMTGLGIRPEVTQQIVSASAAPQMMVRIHDRAVGIDDRLADLVEPCRAAGRRISHLQGVHGLRGRSLGRPR